MLSGEEIVRRVDDAIGSMAIEGIRTSPHQRKLMIDVATGKVDGKKMRQSIAQKYREKAEARQSAGFEP